MNDKIYNLSGHSAYLAPIAAELDHEVAKVVIENKNILSALFLIAHESFSQIISY